MPYIDSTPKEHPLMFEEDNLQDVFGNMLTNNGWTLVRTFYKAVVDTRAYNRLTSRVNYAIAKHTIFSNAEGKLFGFATVGDFNLKFRRENKYPIRRPNDDTDPEDENYGITPSWDVWVKQRYADTVSRTSLYFYMLEKLPNSSLAPDGEVISMVTMPGMDGTAFDVGRDRDREYWRDWYYGFTRRSNLVVNYTDNDGSDMEYDGKILSASPFHVIRSALDIEVFETEWDDSNKEVYIDEADPRVMQSPIVKSTIRAEFLEHIDQPVWHTNWWTDSEVRVKGHVDSVGILLVLQADNAPAWDNNVVPTVPLYFGKINAMDGSKDEGYALFSGTIPPARRVGTSRREYTNLGYRISPGTTSFRVRDVSKLPAPPSLLSIGGSEIVKLISVDEGTGVIEVERGQQGTEAENWGSGTVISRLSTNNSDIDNSTVVSLFDFDDPDATVGETIFPLLKLYPQYPGNGVDSVIVSKSRFGARYQAHYLSFNATTNQIPPARIDEEGKKYPRSYEPVENTDNYKYQFNASRYSDKIHSSHLFVIHPEEGVRGYLDKSIGFNSKSINASNLRVRKENCPEKVYEMYKHLSIGAVSPLTKIPVTPFRPIGLGIYSEDYNPNKEPWDVENDTTPAGEVTIVSVESTQSQSMDVTFDLPEDEDLDYVKIYVDGDLYAEGVRGTDYYRIVGLTTGFTPEVRLTTVDLAGNESQGVIINDIEIK